MQPKKYHAHICSNCCIDKMNRIQKILLVAFALCLGLLIYFIATDIKKKRIKNITNFVLNEMDSTGKSIDSVEFELDNKKHIVIDAGHGGPDCGAIGVMIKSKKQREYFYEKNIARQMGDAVMSMVDTSKYTVIETRPADKNINRHTRIKLAEKFKTDLLLSFHCNSFSNKTWNGIEVDICDSSLNVTDTFSRVNPNLSTNENIANALLNNVSATFPKLKKNKVVHRQDRIWMIYAGNFPSVLLEWAYISNQNDLQIMTNALAQKMLARAVWKTIDEYFGFKTN